MSLSQPSAFSRSKPLPLLSVSSISKQSAYQEHGNAPTLSSRTYALLPPLTLSGRQASRRKATIATSSSFPTPENHRAIHLQRNLLEIAREHGDKDNRTADDERNSSKRALSTPTPGQRSVLADERDPKNLKCGFQSDWRSWALLSWFLATACWVV